MITSFLNEVDIVPLACEDDLSMYVIIVYPLACLTAFLMNDALLSISPAGRGQFVKILINLELHSKFGSFFAYFFILTLSSHWYAKR